MHFQLLFHRVLTADQATDDGNVQENLLKYKLSVNPSAPLQRRRSIEGTCEVAAMCSTTIASSDISADFDVINGGLFFIEYNDLKIQHIQTFAILTSEL